MLKKLFFPFISSFRFNKTLTFNKCFNTSSNIAISTDLLKKPQVQDLQPLLQNISNPETFSDIFMGIKTEGYLKEDSHFLSQIIDCLPKFSIDSLEKLSLNFLFHLMAEITKISQDKERELAFEKIQPLLVLHLQKQDFDGFLRFLEFLGTNPQNFNKFFEKPTGFLHSCIRENFNYFSMACSLDLVHFFPIINLLSQEPFNFQRDFVKTGLVLKLGNRTYLNNTLSLEEMQGFLALDEEFISQKPVLQKILDFAEKKPEEFEAFDLQNLINILIGLYTTRFEYNLEIIERLEFLINKKTNDNLLLKNRNLDQWLKLMNYYFLTNQTDKIVLISDGNMIKDLEIALIEKKKSFLDKEILFAIEASLSFLNISNKEILNEQIQRIISQKNIKSNHNFMILFVSLLLSKSISSNQIEFFKMSLPAVNNLGSSINNSELIYAYKSLKKLRVFKENKEIINEQLQECQYKLEICLNKILKKPWESLLKNPFEFVELISIKYELFQNKKDLIEKILVNPSLESLSFNDIMNLNLALRKIPVVHYIFIDFFKKKLTEFSSGLGLDLRKIRFVSRSLLGFKDIIKDAKLSHVLKDKQYVGSFQMIIHILQENLLRIILKELPKKPIELKQNVFEKFEMEEKEQLKKAKNRGLKKKNPKLNEVSSENIFKDLQENDFNDIYSILESFVTINMGTLPMYYMFWRILESFQKKFNNELLVDWLYLLGNVNRLPKEFPKEIEARLDSVELLEDLKKIPYYIKYLWVLILKNPQEIPLKVIDFLTKTMKNAENPLNYVDQNLRIRLYQIIILLYMQEIKAFDPFLGLSKENMGFLKKDFEIYLKSSRKAGLEEGKTHFQKEIESYFNKKEYKYKTEIIIEYQGFPIILMDYEVNSDKQQQGYLFIMDSRTFLGTSNIELMEGWLIRRLLKVMKLKVKFLEYPVYRDFERRHQKNTYIKSKLKALGLENENIKKEYFDF